MANYQDFSVTRGAVVQGNAQQYHIAGRVVDSDGTTLADFTGAAALHADFGGVFLTFSADQMSLVLDAVAQTVLALKAGVN